MQWAGLTMGSKRKGRKENERAITGRSPQHPYRKVQGAPGASPSAPTAKFTARPGTMVEMACL